MAIVMVPNAPVRDAVTGEFHTGLVGEPVQIIDGLISTPTPYPIQDAAGDPIPSSLVTVQSSFSLPTYYVDTASPADLYMDWYHAGSGARGRVDFDAVLRDAAAASATSSAASAASAAASEAATAEFTALRNWVDLGNTTRNIVADPRATDASRWGSNAGTGGVVNEAMVTGATDGPVLPDGSRVTTYARYTYTTAATSGSNANFGYSRIAADDLAVPIPAGTSEAIAIYVRPSTALSFAARSDRYLDGVGVGGASMGTSTACPAGVWTRVSLVFTPTSDWDGQSIRANVEALTVPNGAVIEVTAAFAEPGATSVPDHYDGNSPSTAYVGNAWSGEANASVSERIDMRLVRSVNGFAPDASGNVAVSGGGDGSTTWTTLAGKPSTFPPSGHTHPRSEISDATTVGRAVMGAVDAQAARAAIGAGTGSGTSNLVLGTTGTTAAAGNHTHAQYVDSAQAATIADERIAASGGTGGGGSILVWRYSSGAYPTLPATAPAGVALVHAMGPVAPSILPSWVGNASNQVPSEYVYNGGLT
jgi:hypothetical protein